MNEIGYASILDAKPEESGNHLRIFHVSGTKCPVVMMPSGATTTAGKPFVLNRPARVLRFIRQAQAPNTLRGYRQAWRHFAAWCSLYERQPLPADPATVAEYLADCADIMAVGTIARRIIAISKAHQAAGFSSPAAMSHAIVRETWRGIRRAKGIRQAQKDPVLVADLRGMIASTPSGLLGFRDRALLLLGFAGAFRRSEIVGLNVEDLRFDAAGLTILLRRSKTDQEGEGRLVGIPAGSDPETCPLRAVRFWLLASKIQHGALFRPIGRSGRLGEARLSDRSVALIVKRYAALIGKDVNQFAGHSLRAGLVTSAVIAGASERSIMNQTGHRSPMMVRRYIRNVSVFQDNAAARTGI